MNKYQETVDNLPASEFLRYLSAYRRLGIEDERREALENRMKREAGGYAKKGNWSSYQVRW